MAKRRFEHKQMYAVSKNGTGLIAGTLAYSRRSAISCFMLNVASPEKHTWQLFKHAGYRTVRAQVRVLDSAAA